MKRVACCLLLLAPGCTCGAPSPVSTGSPAAPPSAPSPAASPPASVPAPSGAPLVGSAPEPAADCDLRWGYHGTVAGQEVFLRLDRRGGALAGRYFYAKVGVDIPLAGTIDASYAVDLVEGDPVKPTGHFKGTCHAGSGALDGTWSNAKGSHPFLVDRVGPRASPLVATRHYRRTKKAETIGPMGMKTCSYDEETFELFGAGSPEAERAIAATTELARQWTSEYDAEVERCETGFEASYTERVIAVFRGLVAVEGGGSSMLDGAAHPNNAEGFERATFDLSTGKAVTEGDLYAKFPEALMKRCLAAYGNEDEGLRGYRDGHLFALQPEGVHVFGAGYPHFAAALTGEGPIVTWAALLREGALRPDSPIRRAWEGIAPAKPGDPECLTDYESQKLAPISTSPPAR